MVSSARHRARKKGWEFSITEEDITIPEECPILGIPLLLGSYNDYDATPSLDRKDPTLGYVPGNVLVVSMRANRFKSDARLDELRKLVRFLEAL